MSSYLSSNSTALPSIHCPNSSSTALPSLHCPNSISTALPSFHCPYFPIFLQWQDSYLTHDVFVSSVFASTINGLTSIITTVSNALVIISLLKSRQFRQNPFMFLFVSLSVTGKGLTFINKSTQLGAWLPQVSSIKPNAFRAVLSQVFSPNNDVLQILLVFVERKV